MNIDVTALLVKINKHFHLYDHDQQHRHHHHHRQRRPSHTHAATRQEQSGLQPHAVGLELPCPIDFCVAGPSLREATIEKPDVVPIFNLTLLVCFVSTLFLLLLLLPLLLRLQLLLQRRCLLHWLPGSRFRKVGPKPQTRKP